MSEGGRAHVWMIVHVCQCACVYVYLNVYLNVYSLTHVQWCSSDWGTLSLDNIIFQLQIHQKTLVICTLKKIY